jgi:hypothetical protein
MSSIPPLFSVSKRRNRRRAQVYLRTNADWEATRQALYSRNGVIPPEEIYRGGMPIEFKNSGTPPSLFWPTGMIQVSSLSDGELDETRAVLRTVLVPPAGETLILQEVRRDPSYQEIRAPYEEVRAGLLVRPFWYPFYEALSEAWTSWDPMKIQPAFDPMKAIYESLPRLPQLSVPDLTPEMVNALRSVLPSSQQVPEAMLQRESESHV